MSETPMTRWDWWSHGMEPNSDGFYVLEEDSDARDQQRVAEIERLRGENEELKKRAQQEIGERIAYVFHEMTEHNCPLELHWKLDDGRYMELEIKLDGSHHFTCVKDGKIEYQSEWKCPQIAALESACRVLGAAAYHAKECDKYWYRIDEDDNGEKQEIPSKPYSECVTRKLVSRNAVDAHPIARQFVKEET